MNPNHLTVYYVPQPSGPYSLSTPIAPQPAYYVHPSSVYSSTSPNSGSREYNMDWDQEQTYALLHTANQVTGGQPSAVGYQCRWHTGGIPCSKAFAQFDKLILHLGEVHDMQGSAVRRIACQWLTDRGPCDKEYRRDGFRRHIGTHVGLSVSCPECGKPFSREDSMRAHKKKKHGKA